jgi:hypothetical protein
MLAGLKKLLPYIVAALVLMSAAPVLAQGNGHGSRGRGEGFWRHRARAGRVVAAPELGIGTVGAGAALLLGGGLLVAGARRRRHAQEDDGDGGEG